MSYGPVWDGTDEPDQWVLRLTTIDGERVEIVLDDHPMYELWTEVRGVPWPRSDSNQKDRMVRQVVHAANDADEQMLQDALDALGVGR